MNAMFNTNSEIMIRQAGISDTGYSAIDERTGAKMSAYPEVEAVTGLIFTAVMLPAIEWFLYYPGICSQKSGCSAI